MDVEEPVVEGNDKVVPLKQKSSRTQRRERRDLQGNKAATTEEEVTNPTPSKRLRVDHKEEIN